MQPLIFLDKSTVFPFQRGLDTASQARLEFASMATLNELILRSGAALVITSDGHQKTPLATHQEFMESRGCLGQVVGVTKKGILWEAERWKEIGEYLHDQKSQKQATRFVILDPNEEMNFLGQNHICVDTETGFCPDQLSAALDRLGDELDDSIHFFDPAHRPYGFLSNFSPHPVAGGEIVWPSAEHFYQASKFTDPLIRETIFKAGTPHEAKRIAHRQAHLAIPDWEQRKEDCMREALAAKFHAHPLLRAALIATGNRELVEASPKDSYLGIGADGKGRNRLGALLMELRTALGQEEQIPSLA